VDYADGGPAPLVSRRIPHPQLGAEHHGEREYVPTLIFIQLPVGKYVTGRRKRFRPHKVYIFLTRITSRVDLAMSVCLSDRMNAEISKTRARLSRFGVQIPELHTQRKFVSTM